MHHSPGMRVPRERLQRMARSRLRALRRRRRGSVGQNPPARVEQCHHSLHQAANAVGLPMTHADAGG